MAVIIPRPYQVEAIEAVIDAQNRGIRRQLISLPTGTGKTIIFALLAKALNIPTLILGHRAELIQQAVDKFSLVWPESDVGIVMADRNEIDKPIVVASVQTASRDDRLVDLAKRGFGLQIIDEAHHAASDSYQKVINSLGFVGNDPTKLLVGLTATPSRGDKKSLGNVFDEVVFDRSLPTMIKAGYLSDIQGKRILTNTDLSSVQTRCGDFIERQLSEVINTKQRNELVVKGYRDLALGKKALAFCVDVAHCKDLSKAFLEKGISSAAVHGDMDKDERRDTLRKFALGEIRVLTSCGVLTEGYDEPSIDCILMTRPTQSLGLYTQCVGRGTRLHPSKKNCLVIDFTDNCHDIGSIATISKALKVAVDERSDVAGTKCPIKENDPRSVYVGREDIGDFDLYERSSYAWIQVKNHWCLQISADTKIWLKYRETGFVAAVSYEKEITYLSSKEIPLEYAQGIAEDWIRKNRKSLTALADKNAPWRNYPATEEQKQALNKMGIKFDVNITKGEAHCLIGQKTNERNLWKEEPVTPQQRYFLRSRGVKCKPGMTKGEASRLIAGFRVRSAV